MIYVEPLGLVKCKYCRVFRLRGQWQQSVRRWNFRRCVGKEAIPAGVWTDRGAGPMFSDSGGMTAEGRVSWVGLGMLWGDKAR